MMPAAFGMLLQKSPVWASSRKCLQLLLAAAFVIFVARADAAPRVLASIKPIHSLAAAVMEGIGKPDLLITGAASEHGYMLRPRDAHAIASADLVFWIGPDLETYLVTPLATLAKRSASVPLEHAAGVHLLPARAGGVWARQPSRQHGGVNPHIWLSPDNAIALTRAMASALGTIDPAHARLYAANADREAAMLVQLKRKIAAELAPVRARKYIVFHDAYPYFEQAFGLSAIGAVTVAPDRPAGPRSLAALHDIIRRGQVDCLFREPQFSPALVQSLVAETKVRVGVLDPLGADLSPGPNLYPRLMMEIADSLRGCLGTRR